MIKIIRVTGDSLLPAYQDGDYVLALRIPILFSRLRPGDVIVFRHAAYGTLIKQVERVDRPGGAVYVTGTHPGSVDSRQFGPVPWQQVWGKVAFQIKKPRR